jgi:hypothetical protein
VETFHYADPTKDSGDIPLFWSYQRHWRHSAILIVPKTLETFHYVDPTKDSGDIPLRWSSKHL